MRWIFSFLATVVFVSTSFAQPETPKVSDPRLVVELVAQAPDIVHPISCDFDHKGRLLVIESHTHFAPKDYQGPKFDRIRMFDVAKKSNLARFICAQAGIPTTMRRWEGQFHGSSSMSKLMPAEAKEYQDMVNAALRAAYGGAS